MTQNDKEENGDEIRSTKIYEIGFLVVPSVPDEKLANEMTGIREEIEKRGGIIISEEFRKIRPLAYSMMKEMGAKSYKFSSAYFGWVKFELPKGEPILLKEAIKTRELVLRFIFIETVRESTLATLRTYRKPDMEKKVTEGGQVSTEEIDRQIENLVTEIK